MRYWALLNDDEITICPSHRYDCCGVRQAPRALLLSRCSGALDLDFSYQICDTLHPISRTVAGELPPIHRRHEEKPDAPYKSIPDRAQRRKCLAVQSAEQAAQRVHGD
jgi:hypothetical protein